MSVVDNSRADFTGPLFAGLRKQIARDIWAWYEEHQDHVIVGKWILSLRVRHCRWIIEQIAGPQPVRQP